ncbi:MAG TPA: OsmC family protein [Cyclobacteriaceae bacterium]|nr:OsmC family protein [Cyclobacteriaceae bacterium]
MKISAHLLNSENKLETILKTNDHVNSLIIPTKESGYGSKINGGELLFLALAICYCNDLNREASKKGINVTSVDVIVEGNFDSEGEPAQNVSYRAKVSAQTS